MDRIEMDSLGEVRVAKEAKWGAQTQRSLENFKIGDEKMPLPVIKALIQIKQACAVVNQKEGKLSKDISESIQEVCQNLQETSEMTTENFPLSVWQTGSGTQTNMNVNEVIAHLTSKELAIHPNDHVNLSQSSNDVFPTAMHMAAYSQVTKRLLPELEAWISELDIWMRRTIDKIKLGRTHLQDATPITFGQEVSGWKGMIEGSLDMIRSNNERLLKLAIGGTAVGTGLNASANFGESVSMELASMTGYPFVSEPNKFLALTSHQPLSVVHGTLRALSADLMKIANDIRWLASGPRGGLGELTLPTNEPGSSIMPGKVNPTQAEALTMVVTQVMGNDVTIQMAASQGNFELNVYKPVIIYNFLQSVTLLSDAMQSFREKCLVGIQVNDDQMTDWVNSSLMLVTNLTPYIGYEKAAKIAQYAFINELTLKEAAMALEYANAADLDNWLDVDKMI
ncbi:class II fumarate hydratase [Fundicoccus sp. Sow4_F4]|uniref:class II fumarate hydratase n=1 Tax=Fundicoccus sp. Sow4_F4 TaxID=3438783 RepID=UPI003F8E9697